MNDGTLSLVIPAELVEVIARRAAEIVQRDPDHGPHGPYVTVAEAAELLRCRPQRIYDLLSQRRLTRLKDGRRVLVSRQELDAHLIKGRCSAIARPLPPTPQAGIGTGFAA